MTNFNQKTVAVSVLLFIAVITPTLTFGAVYGKPTNNQIGTVENDPRHELWPDACLPFSVACHWCVRRLLSDLD
jgi:HCO3- transporter family